jgi:hypothetical protein
MFKKNDWIFGIISVAIGVFVLFNIESLRNIKNSMDPAGPAALPLIIAWSMIVIGIIHFTASLYLIRKESVKEKSEGAKKNKSIMPVLKISIASVIYILILPIIGYPLAMPLLTSSIMLSVGIREKKKIIAVSLMTTIILFASFTFGLKVDLPLGFFESFF